MRYMFIACTLVLVAFFSPTAQSQNDLLRGRDGMVVSACPHATRAGLQILRNGGNAVDAAVAVGFALAVTYPAAGNIGGGTYLIIRMADQREVAVDAREIAPGRAHRDMYLDHEGNIRPGASLVGPYASGVPGTVDGLLTALSRYGTMQRDAVMAPALRYARDGFVPHARLRALLTANSDSFRLYPSTAMVYLPGGRVPALGRKWKQPDLAETLHRIITSGREGFYAGKTAALIASAMQNDGGIITQSDLAEYRCIVREPLRGRYRGSEVLTMPPSSSGGVALLQMLGTLEHYTGLEHPSHSTRSAHIISEIMRRAYADRAVYLGDPAFTRIPVDSLLSAATMKAWWQAIDTLRATPSASLRHDVFPFEEGDQTTHYAVLDKEGNAVSVTTTLNSSFGGFYVVPGTGILLNNEMDDFSVKSGVPNQFGLLGNEANSIQAGKRMLSSMTPTILVRDGRPWLLTGSPGGSRIITSVLQTILNITDFNLSLSQAIAAPRFHHQWYPDRIEYERGAFTQDVLQGLETIGHIVEQTRSFGRVEGILYDPLTGMMQGYSDPRGYGKAAVVLQLR